jgi:hypothetical protein
MARGERDGTKALILPVREAVSSAVEKRIVSYIVDDMY